MQLFIDVDLLKHREHSNRIHSRDDGAKQQARQELYVVEAGRVGRLDLTHAVQQRPDEEGIPQSPHNSKHQDRAHVIHEGADGQEVASIQDDGGQQAEEKQFRVHHRWDILSR